MATTWSMVGVAMPNSVMARAFIIEHAAEALPEYRNIFTSDPRQSFVIKVANTFMAKHPRGKGTTGNEILRGYYAACYALCRAWSQRDINRNFPGDTAFSDEQKRVIMAMTCDVEFDPTNVDELKGVRAATWTSLARHDLISGYWPNLASNTKPSSVWLTDLGLRTRARWTSQVVQRRVAERRKIAERATAQAEEIVRTRVVKKRAKTIKGSKALYLPVTDESVEGCTALAVASLAIQSLSFNIPYRDANGKKVKGAKKYGRRLQDDQELIAKVVLASLGIPFDARPAPLADLKSQED